MKLYNYNPVTKELVSITDARKSPLEEGVYLVPANATTVEPPETEKGTVPVWNGETWILVEDNRGTVVYNTETKEPSPVGYLGKIAAGYTAKVPAAYSIWDPESKSWVEDTELKSEKEAEALAAAALTALQESDVIVLRCYESGVAVPEEWKDYRSELRSLVKKEAAKASLPTAPIEPSSLLGTKK